MNFNNIAEHGIPLLGGLGLGYLEKENIEEHAPNTPELWKWLGAAAAGTSGMLIGKGGVKYVKALNDSNPVRAGKDVTKAMHDLKFGTGGALASGVLPFVGSAVAQAPEFVKEKRDALHAAGEQAKNDELRKNLLLFGGLGAAGAGTYALANMGRAAGSAVGQGGLSIKGDMLSGRRIYKFRMADKDERADRDTELPPEALPQTPPVQSGW